MAADKLPDFDELSVELVQAAGSRARADPAAGLAGRAGSRSRSPFGMRELQRLRLERQAMIDRIVELDALLPADPAHPES